MYKLIKKILRDALPLIYGGVIATLMTFLDGVYLSWYSTNAFNALVFVIPLVGIVGGIGSALAAATANKVTRTMSWHEKIINFFTVTFLLFALSVLVVIAALCMGGGILSFYGLQANQLESIFLLEYWHWILPSFPVQLGLVVMIQVLVIYRKLQFANILLTIITITNVILSPILIFALELGVVGAAISTDLSYLLGMSIFLIKFKANLLDYTRYVQEQSFFRREWSLVQKSLKQLSLDMTMIFFSVIVFSVGTLFFNKLAAQHSILAVTVLGVSEQLKAIFTLPSRGVLGAYITSFANVISEKRIGEYWKLYWAVTAVMAIIYLPGVAFFSFFTREINVLYNVTDPEVQSYLAYFILVNAVFLLTIIIPRTAQISFLSLNRPFLVFLQSISMVVSSYLAAVYLMKIQGLKGLVLGQLLGTIITNVVFFIFFFRLMNLRIRACTLN